jgi:hypothetical protein
MCGAKESWAACLTKAITSDHGHDDQHTRASD